MFRTGPAAAHPACCTVDTGPFSGVKWPGCGVVHPPPFSDEVNMSSYTSAPPPGLRGLFQGEFNLVINIFNIDRIVRYLVKPWCMKMMAYYGMLLET